MNDDNFAKFIRKPNDFGFARGLDIAKNVHEELTRYIAWATQQSAKSKRSRIKTK